MTISPQDIATLARDLHWSRVDDRNRIELEISLD